MIRKERTLVLAIGNVGFDSVSPTILFGDITDLSSFAKRLFEKSDAVSSHLRTRMRDAINTHLADYNSTKTNPEILHAILGEELNKIISGPLLSKDVFQNVLLRPKTIELREELDKKSPDEMEVIQLNRLLLEDAYPLELSRTLDSQPFLERNLSIRAVTKDEALSCFATARALIVAERDGDIAKIKGHFESLLPTAEQHGLALAIFASSTDEDKITSIKTEAMKEKGVGYTVEIYARQKTKEAAEYIARAYVGPFQRVFPKIDPIKLKDPEMEILLRRAFFDCNRIRLEHLLGGKASEGVFTVHAWCDARNVGPRPLPFFIKFGQPDGIEVERQIYQTHAELYIPFNLRPNLDRHRCVRGSKYSALVGNFVEDATPLRETLRQGVGDGVLFALFETSLKAFRVQAFEKYPSKQTTGLDAFVKDRVRGKARPPKIDRSWCETMNDGEEVKEGTKILTLAASYGLKSKPEALEKLLCDTAKDIPHWWGPTHGDLHAGNVMVRRGDSILIDFGSVADGPLTADPATLEVSLVFGTDAEDDAKDFDEWKAFVDSAYACIPCIRPPTPASEPTTFVWLRQAVRELRHILFGCDCHDNEAAIVIAAFLMRFARLPIETFDDPKLADRKLYDLAVSRRAYGLLVAEKLVNSVASLTPPIKK